MSNSNRKSQSCRFALKPMRIRIRIQIRIRIRDFDDQKVEKFTAENFFYFISLQFTYP
jgi:hypothetical protein